MKRAAGFPIAGSLVLLLLAVGTAVTVSGLWHKSWPGSSAIGWPGLSAGYLYFLAVCAVLIGCIGKLARVGYVTGTMIPALAIVVLAGGVWPLLAVSYYAAASLSLGHLVLKRLSRSESEANAACSVLVGACLYASAVGVGVHFPVNHAWAYLLMLSVPTLLARGHLLRVVRATAARLAERVENRPGAVERSLLGALVLLYLAMAFLPELSHDPLAMHLFAPGYVAANRYWNFDPTLYGWTFMPMLADWSYTIGYVLAGEAAARLVNLGFVLLSVFFVREFVLWLNGDERGADWAALLLLSTPLTVLVGCSLYVEAFWSACLLAGALWLFRAVFDSGRHPSGMLLSGMAFGFAAAGKAVALPYLPLLAAPVAFRPGVLGSRRFRRSMLWGVLACLVLGAWPYVLAYVETGNPVFPFFNSIFRSPLSPAADFENSLFNTPLTWDLPYRVVFSAEDYGGVGIGASGFQWLTLAVPATAAIAVARDLRALLLLGIALFSVVVIFQFQAYLRYVIPALLLLCVVLGVAVSACARRHRWVGGGMLAVAGLTVLLNLLFLGSATTKYRDVPVLDLFRAGGADALVQVRAPVRNAVELVNVVNELGFSVAFMSSSLAAGLKSEAMFTNWYNRRFRREIYGADDVNAFLRVLKEHRAKYVIFDRRKKQNAGPVLGYIEEIGVPLAEFGAVTVYRIDDRHFYSEEMLQKTGKFIAPPWTISSGVERMANGAVLVSNRAPVVQGVAVREDGFYLNTVKARCEDGDGYGRVQVNWHDKRGRRLKSDIRVFRCATDWSLESQELVAPAGASTARVFGASHANTPLQVAEISFRSTGA
ncbi:MAG: hypothetical protein OXQ29_03985 [Rhodospirillaceae bacterium]|nr:hypothetical protein [Rhodospirillaceae bacterium]